MRWLGRRQRIPGFGSNRLGVSSVDRPTRRVIENVLRNAIQRFVVAVIIALPSESRVRMLANEPRRDGLSVAAALVPSLAEVDLGAWKKHTT